MTREGPSHRTALELAARQRESSVAEFFLKNRHLLGFDSPSKALLTTAKEAVDNALDACEEAGILPEIPVEVSDEGDSVFQHPLGGDVDLPCPVWPASPAPGTGCCARRPLETEAI